MLCAWQHIRMLIKMKLYRILGGSAFTADSLIYHEFIVQ